MGEALLLPILIYLGVKDYRERILPNRALAVLLFMRTFSLVKTYHAYKAGWMDLLLSSLLGLFSFGLLFFLVYLLAKGSFGAGDVKMIALLGFCFGLWRAVHVLLLSFGLLLAVCMVRLLWKKGAWQERLPLGTFLAIGASVSVVVDIALTNMITIR